MALTISKQAACLLGSVAERPLVIPSWALGDAPPPPRGMHMARGGNQYR